MINSNDLIHTLFTIANKSLFSNLGKFLVEFERFEVLARIYIYIMLANTITLFVYLLYTLLFHERFGLYN